MVTIKIIEIKEGLNKWKDIPYSWFGRLNTVQMAISPKLVYTFNKIPIKIWVCVCVCVCVHMRTRAKSQGVCVFAEIDKLILKIIWKCKGPRMAKPVLTRNRIEGLTLPDFTAYHKAMLIKTVWYDIRLDIHIIGTDLRLQK